MSPLRSYSDRIRQSDLVYLVGIGRILVGIGRILVGFGRILPDLVRFGRIWSDLVGFGRIWSDSVGVASGRGPKITAMIRFER